MNEQEYQESRQKWEQHLIPLVENIYKELPTEAKKKKELTVYSIGSGRAQEIPALKAICKRHHQRLLYIAVDSNKDLQDEVFDVISKKEIDENTSVVFLTVSIDNEAGMRKLLKEYNVPSPDIVLIRHPPINPLNHFDPIFARSITLTFEHALQHTVAKISDGALVVGTSYNCMEAWAFKTLMGMVHASGEDDFTVRSYSSKVWGVSPIPYFLTSDAYYLIIPKFEYKYKPRPENNTQQRTPQVREPQERRREQPPRDAVNLSRCGIFAIGTAMVIGGTVAIKAYNLMNNSNSNTGPAGPGM